MQMRLQIEDRGDALTFSKKNRSEVKKQRKAETLVDTLRRKIIKETNG